MVGLQFGVAVLASTLLRRHRAVSFGVLALCHSLLVQGARLTDSLYTGYMVAAVRHWVLRPLRLAPPGL